MPDFKSLLLYPLPHHLVSRVVFHLTRLSHPFTPALIRWFVRRYGVELADAVETSPDSYPTFNAFFTRALREGARELPKNPGNYCCPADGRISAFGRIEEGTLFQAKEHNYSVESLLADADLAKRFHKGSFITVYLSPRDYHRVHMPCDATLVSMTRIPGRLFSVAPHTVNSIPSLFARNERVSCLFDTPTGQIAMVLVGAINVAAIETVWAGLVTPKQGESKSQPDFRTYPQQSETDLSIKDDSQPVTNYPVKLSRGDEMGRFNMGSTVILVTESPLQFDTSLGNGSAVRMGNSLGLPTQPV